MNRKLHIAALALQVLTFSACGGGEKKDETAAKVEAREEHLGRLRRHQLDVHDRIRI